MQYIYTGDGRHFAGLPASDLDEDAVAALTPEQGALLLAGIESGMYTPVPLKIPKGKKPADSIDESSQEPIPTPPAE